MRKRKTKHSYKIKIEGKKQVIRHNSNIVEIERMFKDRYPLSNFKSSNILETYSKIRQTSHFTIYILTDRVSNNYTRKIIAYVKRL